MKRHSVLLLVVSLCWLAVMVGALSSGSTAGNLLALLAGLALIGSAFLVLRANDREQAAWQQTMQPGASFESILRYGLDRGQYPQAALGWPHDASPTPLHLTLSIGIALLHAQRREPAASLLRRADAALYRAKAEVRDRAVCADMEGVLQ